VTDDNVRSAEVELSCPDLAAAIVAFGKLGFRVDMIMPADDPQVAVVSGHGLRLRLLRGTRRPPGVIRLVCRDPAAIASEFYGTTPEDSLSRGTAVIAGGIRIELVAERSALTLPPLQPSFLVTRDEPSAWRVGRASMLYRDLIPDRQGGRFIASHIRIPDGGPVADYVHYHPIRFQMIYCYKGWVRLVYEDQGEPFVLLAGDCVMQPPQIRHRVLEASPGLETIEICTPATHETYADHELTLPTPNLHPDREFEGQRFALHSARGTGFEAASLGIATASGGIASARVLRRANTIPCTHDAELLFGFVLQGEMTVTCEGVGGKLVATDAFVVPAHQRFELADGSPDLAWLEVTLPARVTYTRSVGS
jgi:mannose-6-phosphate isomerase-like protein (cupin superfamily)